MTLTPPNPPASVMELVKRARDHAAWLRQYKKHWSIPDQLESVADCLDMSAAALANAYRRGVEDAAKMAEAAREQWLDAGRPYRNATKGTPAMEAYSHCHVRAKAADDIAAAIRALPLPSPPPADAGEGE